MIISASRRTDIPAFYTDWLLARLEAQYCTMVNPFNRNQVSYVSLRPQDVEAVVFWTKNAGPLLPHLHRLDKLGFRYYFQYTLNGYGPPFEPRVPPLDECIETFRALSRLLGPEKVIWRYDPILLSNRTDMAYHQQRFSYILDRLHRDTRRVVVSIADAYRKAALNFARLRGEGVTVAPVSDAAEVGELLRHIAARASAVGLSVQSCAEIFDLQPYGIQAGRCIDAKLIETLFGISVGCAKDKAQRKECGCIVSKDIGHYDTCLHGCAYCYAGTLRSGQENRRNHQPGSPSLLGNYTAPPQMKLPGKV